MARTCHAKDKWLSARLCLCMFFVWFVFTNARSSLAQSERSGAFEGFVTRVDSSGDFWVDRHHVVTTQETRYVPLNPEGGHSSQLLRQAIQIGAHVKVTGTRNFALETLVADSVQFCPVQDKKLSGIAAIEKVFSVAPELVFQADGYRIRVATDAEVTYRDNARNPRAVIPNTWIQFTGKRDSTGVVIASQLRFLSPKIRTTPTSEPGAQKQGYPEGNIVNEDGTVGILDGKFKFDESSGWHRLTADHDLQERVRRTGSRLVPEYQRRLADDDPSKIAFRFFVTEEKWMRTDMRGGIGVILVARSVVDRLESDDELAAVLADDIAFDVQLQRAKLLSNGVWESAGEAAAMAAVAAQATGTLVAGAITKAIINREMEERLEEERARMALSMMAEGGYDPWIAPEAWRRLRPRKLPKDLSNQKYPHISEYQFEILSLQYPVKRVINGTNEAQVSHQ